MARRIFDIAFDRTIDDEERLSEEQLDEQITRDSCPPRPPLARRRRGRRAPWRCRLRSWRPPRTDGVCISLVVKDRRRRNGSVDIDSALVTSRGSTGGATHPSVSLPLAASTQPLSVDRPTTTSPTTPDVIEAGGVDWAGVWLAGLRLEYRDRHELSPAGSRVTTWTEGVWTGASQGAFWGGFLKRRWVEIIVMREMREI